MEAAYVDRQVASHAREPALLGGVRQKLSASMKSIPSFNTKRFARHIEAAYDKAHEKQAVVLKQLPDADAQYDRESGQYLAKMIALRQMSRAIASECVC